VEAYLQQLPALRKNPEAVLDLIYNEMVLRHHLGEAPSLEEYLQRFPEYDEPLRRQFSVYRALAGGMFLEGLSWSGPETGRLTTATPPPAAVDAPYPHVAGYRILGVLGRGGMGLVYKAEQLGLKRIVALKMILAGGHAGAEQLARFRAEAEAIARLRHPNIVQVYEVGEQDGLPFFSLEYVEGGSLDKHLGTTPKAPHQAADLIETLARAVQAAHERGVIHRDLKPANVLLGTDGTPKVTDFGLAKRLDEAGQTEEGAVMGTPAYMAPEQALGQLGHIGPATDVYALGVIFYQMLTGRPPFQAGSTLDTLQLVIFEEPVPPRRLQPKVPRDLETICLKCLQKSTRRRYTSALDLAEDLRRFRDHEPIRARPIGVLERGIKWARRHPTAATLAVSGSAACLALLAGAALWYHGRTQAEVNQARADTAEARAGQREAEERERLLRKHDQVRQCLLAGQEAQAQENVAEARVQVEQARTLLRDEPGLTDMQDRVDRLAAEVERREVVRRNYDHLFTGRDEALFYLNRQVFTGLDQADSLAKARAAAEAALRPFRLSADSGQPFVVDELYSPGQKTKLTQGCFEVLLILAEATARVLPGQAEDEQRDRAQKALRILERADPLVPGTRIVHRLRGRYLRRLGDEAHARRERDLAAAEGPATPLDLFLTGYDDLEQGRVQEAARHFDLALRERGDLFWAHFFRALAYQKLQQPAEARASLTFCISQQPSFLWGHLLRGFLHGEMAERAAAEEERLRQALAAGTANPDLQARRDRAAREKQAAFDAADADLDRAEQLPPQDATGYVLLIHRGVLRLRQQRYPEAVNLLQQAARLRPGQHYAYVNLAEAYRHQGQLDQALAQLKKAIDLAQARLSSSDLAALYRTLARLHLERRDLEAALHAWQETLARDEEAARTGPGPTATFDLAADHLEQARLLYRGRQYAEAVEQCDEALRLRRDLVVAEGLRGLALVQLQKYRDAVIALDRYVEKGLPSSSVFQARAQAHLALNEYPAAVQDYSRALDRQPADPELLAARGWAYLANDEPRMALPDFQQVIQLVPGNADARNGRGYARVRLAHSAGALEQAVADAEEARQRAPSDARVLFHAARIYAQAVARLDADASRALETRSRYQDRAVSLLGSALAQTPRASQATFWREQIARDPMLAGLRASPAYRRLALEYGTPGATDTHVGRP
jgi:tetratricopeptide (TPR) repeat protein